MRRSSITISASFHVIAFILAVTGLPFLAKREFIIPQPIVVDFLDISKVTETDKITPKPVPQEKKEPEKKDTPPPAAKNTSDVAVAPVKEKVKPEDKKDNKKAAVLDKDAPPDKKKKIEKEQAEEKPNKDFASVLKNLADPKTVAQPSDDLTKDKTATAATGQNAPIGAKMTMSEEDALRKQLEKCWNVPFGAKDVENMVVEIFMVINPDRTLREARIVDTIRYNSDNFYRATADSALRAVRSSLCSPFDLPPDKYDTWNTITVRFNPKDMF